MIDHVSLAVRDLKAARRFYEPLLATLGMTRLREWPDAAIGYGKKYPEFWINRRPDMAPVAADGGVHICLRASDAAMVDAFHAAGLAAGGTAIEDPPGPRNATGGRVLYLAYLRDPGGNKICALHRLK